MRVLTGAIAGLVLGLAATAVEAQTPPEGLVWMALRDINDASFDRDDPTNRPPLVTAPPEGMIRAVDVSQDGRPDWLVDYQPSGPNQYCGTGGCLQRLYISDEDGLVRAFDAQALGLTVRPDGEVEAWVHHSYCRGEDWECRFRFRWDAGERRLVQTWASASAFGDENAFVPIAREAVGD